MVIIIWYVPNMKIRYSWNFREKFKVPVCYFDKMYCKVILKSNQLSTFYRQIKDNKTILEEKEQ